MLFVILVGTCCLEKFHTGSCRFEMVAKMSLGGCEVRSGYLALSFISCRDFVRTQFADAVISRCKGKFHTASDGFEMHAKMSEATYEAHSGCWHSVSLRVSISSHVAHRTSWNLFGEKFRTNSDGFAMLVEMR